MPPRPGPAALCPRLCLKSSVLVGRIQWGWGLPGEEVHGGGAENDPAPPRAAALASWREGGLLRAEHLSLLPLLRPDACSLVKDEIPQAEPGSVQGNVCPRTPPPAAKSQGSFMARPLLQCQREDPCPISAGELVPVFSPSLETLPLSPRTQGDNKTTCSPIYSY